MMDNNQDDLWKSDASDDNLFDSAGETSDIFGDAPVGEPSSASETKISEPSPATGSSAGERIPNAPVAKAQSDGYVVLARKYRPQTFDDIVGQEGVEQALRGAIVTGQISHSYLFSGPRGTGKTSTARILAKAVNCQENGPRPDPCGKCASCRSITVGSSLDVIEIDAASNTGVDNIRELKSGVVLAPFSRYKVYIIDEVHMLSNQAFNALLKTLEEPPSQVIFVLATTELHKVPETIISRCQTFMFRRFSLDELKKQLGSILDIEMADRGLNVTDEDREKILDLIARNAEGGMRDAQVTLDQILVLSKGTMDFESVRRFLGMADTEALDLFVKLVNERKSRELLELIDNLVTAGQDLELFVKGVCGHMRDLMLIKCAGRDTTMINVSDDRRLELEKMAAGISPSFLVDSVDHLLKVVGEMKISGQPRITLELAVLKLSLTPAGPDISEILKRLDSLEKGQPQTQAAPAAQATPATAKVSSPEQSHSRLQAEQITSASPESASIPHEASAPEVAGNTSAMPPLAPGNAQSMVEGLIERLKADSSMLLHSFEKALCGQDFDGRNLTIYLDSAQKMQTTLLTRPQNQASITETIQNLYGNIRVQLQLKEVSQIPPAPIDSQPKMPTENVVAQPVNQMVQSDADSIPSPTDSENEKLKIYYPEEIREKTMVEVPNSEFQQMRSADSKLNELVEKTKHAFGIDENSLKFHRSTLA